jgi:hypothetical protein
MKHNNVMLLAVSLRERMAFLTHASRAVTATIKHNAITISVPALQ